MNRQEHSSRKRSATANSPPRASRPNAKRNCAKWIVGRANYLRLCLSAVTDKRSKFSLATAAIRPPYSKEVVSYCMPFRCEDKDLDDFFANDAIFYDIELLGKTYAWVESENTRKIVGMITLANDSVNPDIWLKRLKTDFSAVCLMPNVELIFRLC